MNLIPLIAPYWNWNRVTTGSENTFTGPLIAPYWNWNSGPLCEFKVTLVPLIAPYWNWNKLFGCVIFFSLWTFNRTILELKWNKSTAVYGAGISFNRTILELKSNCFGQIRQNSDSFNRTILELKYQGGDMAENVIRPLIAPYWNWNVVIIPTSSPVFVL